MIRLGIIVGEPVIGEEYMVSMFTRNAFFQEDLLCEQVEFAGNIGIGSIVVQYPGLFGEAVITKDNIDLVSEIMQLYETQKSDLEKRGETEFSPKVAKLNRILSGMRSQVSCCIQAQSGLTLEETLASRKRARKA